MFRRYLSAIFLSILAASFIYCENGGGPSTLENQFLQKVTTEYVEVTINGHVICSECGESTMLVDVIEKEGLESYVAEGIMYNEIGDFKIDIKAKPDKEILIKVFVTSEGAVLMTRSSVIDVPGHKDEVTYSIDFSFDT